MTLPSYFFHCLRIAVKTAFMTDIAIQKLPKTLIFDDFAAIFVLYIVWHDNSSMFIHQYTLSPSKCQQKIFI